MDKSQILIISSIVLANIGTMIGLYIHAHKKMEDHNRDTIDMIRNIQKNKK